MILISAFCGIIASIIIAITLYGMFKCVIKERIITAMFILILGFIMTSLTYTPTNFKKAGDAIISWIEKQPIQQTTIKPVQTQHS